MQMKSNKIPRAGLIDKIVRSEIKNKSFAVKKINEKTTNIMKHHFLRNSFLSNEQQADLRQKINWFDKLHYNIYL